MVKPGDISILSTYVNAAAKCKKCKLAEELLKQFIAITNDSHNSLIDRNRMIDETEDKMELFAGAKAALMENCGPLSETFFLTIY